MPRVVPVDLAESEDAKVDHEWLASATGFVANFMLALSHRPSFTALKNMAELKRHLLEEQIVETGTVTALFGFNDRWNALIETDIEDRVTSFAAQSSYHGPGDTKPDKT